MTPLQGSSTGFSSPMKFGFEPPGSPAKIGLATRSNVEMKICAAQGRHQALQLRQDLFVAQLGDGAFQFLGILQKVFGQGSSPKQVVFSGNSGLQEVYVAPPALNTADCLGRLLPNPSGRQRCIKSREQAQV